MNIQTAIEHWPIAGRFVIARGARTEAVVVVVTIEDGTHQGHGECVPYARYGETPESVIAQIKSYKGPLDRAALQHLMPPGAARNALDCALWDYETKKSGRRPWTLKPITTAYTLSLDTPEAMAQAAKANAHRPILKIKLGGQGGDLERLQAVRQNAPTSRLIVDANEGWQEQTFAAYMQACAEAKVELIEQPLPEGQDEILRDLPHSVPLCADESAHQTSDLDALRGKYEYINIKLDKTGGLTEALHMAQQAREKGFKIMIGCMVGTSLAMAPAFILAQHADIIDLDGPLLLAKDREKGLKYQGSEVFAPETSLWG